MRKTKLVTALFFISLIVFSCHHDDDVSMMCNVSNPIEDLEWLKNRIDELVQTGNGEFYISQANYNGKTIFIEANCCLVCNSIIPVYYCSGESVGYIGDDNLTWTLLDNDKVIWKPDDFKCF